MDGEEGDSSSPFFFCERISDWLEVALDSGLSESEFWEMTLAEIDRCFQSRLRVMKLEEQKQAAANYRLADLIGRSIARVYNSNNKFPSLYEAYPHLFNTVEAEVKIQQRKDELSTLRFKEFAQSYNKKFKEVGK